MTGRDATPLLGIIGLAASSVLVLRVVPLAASDIDNVWLLSAWNGALLICALLSGSWRWQTGLAAWAAGASLALLAQGPAGHVIGALMMVAFAVAIATLLEVPMYAPEILITSQDSERIARLLDVLPPTQREAVDRLEHELERARVVDPKEIPRDVVTMNSRVLFEDVETGKRSEAVLVYPQNADLVDSRISVLAPVGSALLGMRIGQTIDWTLPNGKLKRYRVLDVVYQPEAAGDFHL